MESKRIAEIRSAQERGKLPRCFSRADLRTACPCWPEGTYKAFLPKHCEGYAAEHGNTVLFARRSPGVYVLIEEAGNCEGDERDPWDTVASWLEEALPAIDDALSGANVPISARVQRAFDLIHVTMLKVPDYQAFLLSAAHGRFLVILTEWYRQRYGDAVEDDAVGFVAAVLVHGTPFVIRVPRHFNTADEDPDCVWVGFPAAVQAEEEPLDWIQPQAVVAGLSGSELEDVRRTALRTADRVRSIGVDVRSLESEANTTIAGLATSVRADLQACAKCLCERDEASLRSSAWLASQATEKALKVLIASKGRKPRHIHDLFKLATLVEKLGARPIDRTRLALVPSGKAASGIRYGGDMTLVAATNAYDAALSIVEQVVFDAMPDNRIDLRGARFKVKRPPWFDFDTEAFREGLSWTGTGA